MRLLFNTSQSKCIFCLQVRGFVYLVDFLNDGSLIDRRPAQRAKLEISSCIVVLDECNIACLVELVIRMAGKLCNFLAYIHLHETDTALACGFGTQSRIDCASKPCLSSVQE